MAMRRRRSSNSDSNSSSDHWVSGFFAPPNSVFLVTSRTMPSSNFVRCDPPGGESKYCLTIMAANPLAPPKYSITRSSSSLECGMFSPPLPAAFVKALRAPSSMALMSRSFCFFFLPLLAFARQTRQRVSHVPSFLTRKWSRDWGNVWPQSVQVLSVICLAPPARQRRPLRPDASHRSRRCPTQSPVAGNDMRMHAATQKLARCEPQRGPARTTPATRQCRSSCSPTERPILAVQSMRLRPFRRFRRPPATLRRWRCGARAANSQVRCHQHEQTPRRPDRTALRQQGYSCVHAAGERKTFRMGVAPARPRGCRD